MKLGELAEFLGGELRGDPGVEVTGASGIRDASEGEVTFVSDRKHMKELSGCRASTVIVSEFISDVDKAQIKVSHPYYSFSRALGLFHVKPRPAAGVSPQAYVGKNVDIADDASVYPFAYVSDGAVIGSKTVIYPGVFIGEGASLGDDCVIYPNVVIREGIRVGHRVVIHAGAVIGSDGFGYIFHEGRHAKVPQVGGVIIGDDVEIGANSAIDRATTGNTTIGGGTKIDNLVQIGHNVTVGELSLIVALVGIGGSTKIGDGVIIGGQAGIADHSDIEDGVVLAAGSGTFGTVKKGIYSGFPAIEHRAWLRASATYPKLPEMQKKLRELDEEIKELKRRSSE